MIAEENEGCALGDWGECVWTRCMKWLTSHSLTSGLNENGLVSGRNESPVGAENSCVRGCKWMEPRCAFSSPRTAVALSSLG